MFITHPSLSYIFLYVFSFIQQQWNKRQTFVATCTCLTINYHCYMSRRLSPFFVYNMEIAQRVNIKVSCDIIIPDSSTGCHYGAGDGTCPSNFSFSSFLLDMMRQNELASQSLRMGPWMCQLRFCVLHWLRDRNLVIQWYSLSPRKCTTRSCFKLVLVCYPITLRVRVQVIRNASEDMRLFKF